MCFLSWVTKAIFGGNFVNSLVMSTYFQIIYSDLFNCGFVWAMKYITDLSSSKIWKSKKFQLRKLKNSVVFFSRKFFNCRITKMRFPVIWKKRAQRICHWQYFINFVLCYLSFFFLRFIPENGGAKAPSVLLHCNW